MIPCSKETGSKETGCLPFNKDVHVANNLWFGCWIIHFSAGNNKHFQSSRYGREKAALWISFIWMHSTKYFRATFSSAKNNSVKALQHTATWEIKSTDMQIKLVGMQICLFVRILLSSFYSHISFDTWIIFVCWIQKTKCICIIKQVSQNTFLPQNKTHANRGL